ncbi:Telomere-binding protein [Eptesipox virus]|uniref:Telomere-binding protein n=1 Tax=Eptesipox virus TaxID=1329402 RepID=A0A220T6B7_9POXV|nr:Telomere-binding protein [Eptesipox virus]ASK51252.1 Telomere-binding protein [Eptesipox virus]WAH71010.1 telomere-binding protein [Eptesipox virus]
MNNFIKQAASKLLKPTIKLIQKNENKSYKECIISFDFEDFYYCNNIIFNKNLNTVDDVIKSWTILNSFTYEKYILKGLIKIIKKYSYINDIYFLPIGWLTGTGEIPTSHVVIKVLLTDYFSHFKNKIKEYLTSYSVLNLIIQTDKESVLKTFMFPDILPMALITLYPFDVEYILIVLFFGTCDESYCGITYITSKDMLSTVIEILKPITTEINVICDDITKTFTVKYSDSSQVEKFPSTTLIPICEIITPFNNDKFFIPQKIQPVNISTYISKKIVSLIDLPSYVDIKCISKNGVDYITHINTKKLKTVLIIAKDDFLKDVIFSGTFKKENLIWKGAYTYRIIESNFIVPELKVSNKGKRYVKKYTYNNSTFTTKTGSYIV